LGHRGGSVKRGPLDNVTPLLPQTGRADLSLSLLGALQMQL